MNLFYSLKGKQWCKILCIGLFLIVLSACGATGTNDQKNVNEPQKSVSVEKQFVTTYPLTITDDSGTELTFESEPKTIVSILPSETEVIFAVGAGDRVIGVDEFSNYPEEALSIEKIGDLNTNIESVIALNPDIVFASTTVNGDAVTRLRDLGVTVFDSDLSSYDEVAAHIQRVGLILNQQVQANEVAQSMLDTKQKIVTAVSGLEPKKVYVEVSPGWTVGSGEFMNELIQLAGGTNVAESQVGWFEVNSEAIISADPQVIIYPNLGEENNSILVGMKARPGWDSIDAMKNGQIYEVTNDPLVRVGPRVADGLKELIRAIHPELYVE